MPPLTYAQVRKEQKALGRDEMSSAAYAELMNRLTRSQNYNAALGSGLGKGVKGVSHGVDQVLNWLGLPQMSGDIGAGIFGEKYGRAAFEPLPRMTVDMLPMLVGGPGTLAAKAGIAAGAATQAGNVYEKTDSGLAAGVTAALTPLFPLASKLGGKVGAGIATKFGASRHVTQAAALGPEGLLLNKAATEAMKDGVTYQGIKQAVTPLAMGGVYKSPVTRLAEATGAQTGILGAVHAQSALTAAAAAPSGDRWNAFQQTLTDPHHLLVEALSLTPFAAKGGIHALRANKEVQFVKEYSGTIARYQRDVVEPQLQAERVNSVRQQLQEAVQQKLLPAPGQSTAGYKINKPLINSSGRLAQIEAAKRNEVVGNVNRATVSPKDSFGAIQLGFRDGLLQTTAATSVMTPELVAHIQTAVPGATALLQAGAHAGSLWTQLPLAGKVQALALTDPKVFVPAAMLKTNTTPTIMAEGVKPVVVKGVPVEEVVGEKVGAMVAKAKKQTARQQRAEVAREAKAARKAAGELSPRAVAATAGRMEMLGQVLKASPTEVQQTFAKALQLLGPSAHPGATDRMAQEVIDWVAETKGDLSELPQLATKLAGAAKQQQERQVRHDTIEYAQALDADGQPTSWGLKKPKGGPKGLATPLHKSTIDVDNLAESLRVKGAPHYSRDGLFLFRKQWADTSGEEAFHATNEDVPLGQHDAALEEQVRVDMREKAVEPQEHVATDMAIEHVLDPDTFAESLRDSDVEKLAWGKEGTEAFEYGRGRVADFLRIRKLPVEERKQAITDSPWWDSFKEGLEWIQKYGPEIKDQYMSRIGQVVTAPTGKKFLSLVPGAGGLEAGGGFYYNVGKWDPTTNKLGKHTVPKSGVVSEAQFTKVGRGSDQPLTKDEVALYKTLVPEAFEQPGMINVKTLMQLLPQREPVVEIVTMGKGQRSPSMQRRAALEHQLDTANPNWKDYDDTTVYPLAKDINELSPEIQTLIREYEAIDYRPDGAQAQHGSVAPRAERDMPGYVEGLLRATGPRKFKHDHFDQDNVIGFFRGYEETLPDGTKAFHVIEVQSDWGQERRKAEQPDSDAGLGDNSYIHNHPLLSAYENLTLKAAVKHARENGAMFIDVSKAKTAMKSEGHVEGGTQEKGMVLHYDVSLQSEARRITGDSGKDIVLGEHKNGGPIEVRRYDISRVPIAEKGTGPVFGPQAEQFVGQRETLGGLLQAVGLENHVDEATALVNLMDNSEVGYAQLHGGPESPLGLFTQQKDGQKLVWLAASEQPASRKLFALAHEFNGHYMFKMAQEGKLDAETTHRLQEAVKFIDGNTPQENQLLLGEVAEMLPAKFRKDTGLAKLINSTAHDAEEVLSNINSMVSLAMVHAETSKFRAFMNYMPKPIADMVHAFAKYGRKFFESVSGVLFAREQGWVKGRVDPEARVQLQSYIDGLYKVLKYDKQRVEDARQATRLQMATNGKYLQSALASGEPFQLGQVSSGSDQLIKYFGLDREPLTAKGLREPKMRTAMDALGPATALVLKHPDLAEHFTMAQKRELQANQLENDAFEKMGLQFDGVKFKYDKNVSTERVDSDPTLTKAEGLLVEQAQRQKQSVSGLYASGDPVVKALLGKHSTADQNALLDSIARKEAAHDVITEGTRDLSYEKMRAVIGVAISMKDRTLSHDTVKAQAAALVDSLRGGTPTTVALEHLPVAQKMAQSIEANYTKGMTDKYHVSYQRFGRYSVKAIPKGGGDIEVYNFDDKASQLLFVSNNEATHTITSLQKDSTLSSVKKSALDELKELEAQQAPEVQALLEQNGITRDKARELVDSFSLSGEMEKEMLANMLPIGKVKREFVKGYEQLNVLKQSLEWTQMMAHGLTKGVFNAEHNLAMLDNRLDGSLRTQLQQVKENYQTPDGTVSRGIRQLAATAYLTLNIVNMAQDAVQPITGALQAYLVNDGGGVVRSMSRTLGAMKDVRNPSRLSKNEQAALGWLRKGNRGLASYSDEYNNEALKNINSHEISQGRKASTLGELVMKPFNWFLLTNRGFHKNITDFGVESAYLTAYRHYIAKGRTHEQAQTSAFSLSTAAMVSGGKGARSATLASGKGVWQPVGTMMTVLQAFAWNQITTWKTSFERMIGQVKGLSTAQRKDAGKAFAVHSGLMFAQAGLFGLPLVAAGLALLDRAFGINTKEAIADFLQSDDSDDHTVQQLAMHGMLNLFGADVASRSSVPGVLGLNPRDGFSWEALAGPVGSLATRPLGANPFQRAVQMWKDDWEFRRKDGTMLETASDAEKGVYTLLGLKPTRVANLQERDNWQRVDAEIEQDERQSWVDETAQLFEKGDVIGVKTEIYKRLHDRPGESPNAIANAIVDRTVNRTMPRDASRSPGSSEALNQTAGVASHSMSETQRLQLQQALLQRLGVGLPPSQHSYALAQRIDSVRQREPWLSYQQARERVEDLTGQNQRQSFRGYSYGQR